MIQAIVSGCADGVATPRADALGFQRAAGIDEAVQFFIEDDPVTQKALAE
jgi:hypothetical protein